MIQKQAETILEHILSAPVRIIQLQPLSHPGTGTVTRISTNDKDYLLKSYPFGLRPSTESEDFWKIESDNLALLTTVTTISKPHYFGCYENQFLQEFIPGDLFEDAINSGQLTESEQHALFRAAVDELTRIHAGLSQIKDRRRLRRLFEPARLDRRLHDAAARIQSIGFPAMKQRGFSIDPNWPTALEQFPYERVLQALGTTRDYVLGHGDYKPNNLIITADRRIAVIDWLGLGKAQPWFDLAYLLNSAPRSQHEEHITQYLEAMQGHGLLRNLSLPDAQTLAKAGTVYQELIRANSNARYIETRTDPHHVNEFTAALDGLARLVL